MKLFKRLLCGALIAALLLPAAMAAPSESSFPDTQGHWAQEQIEAAVRSGWVNGYPDGTFRPNATITRAEFVKMLLSATKMTPNYSRVQWMMSKNKTNQGPLNDMANHWLTKQELTDVALATGIVVADDYYKHNFQPEQAIARYEIALMADRALGLVYPATHQENINLAFTDKSSIQDWMLGYVKEATDLGILKGYPDGSFGPKKTATRAEAVVIVSRVISEMTKGLEKAPITVVFQNSSSNPPHTTKVMKNVTYLNIDGTFYISARLLLQGWYDCDDYDSYGFYDDPVTWDPITQCVGGPPSSFSVSAFYPGTTAYNFNRSEYQVYGYEKSMKLVDQFIAPARMLSGEVMIPVYSETGDSGWKSSYDNTTGILTLWLADAVSHPIT